VSVMVSQEGHRKSPLVRNDHVAHSLPVPSPPAVLIYVLGRCLILEVRCEWKTKIYGEYKADAFRRPGQNSKRVSRAAEDSKEQE
jgi:hypothetical protein